MGKRFDEGGPVADQNPQLGVSQLPPVNSNQPAPLPNPQGQYADAQGLQDLLGQIRQQSTIEDYQPKMGSAILDKLMAGIKATESQLQAARDREAFRKLSGGQLTKEEGDYLNQHGTMMGMGAPPGGVDDDDDSDPFAKAKGGYVNTLEFWNKEKNRIGKQLESGNYDGPASVEVAELKKNRSVIKSKIAKKAKGGKIDIPHLRVISGGKPKASLEERATQLENIQRIIDAYKQAQDAADKAKKDLGVPEPQGVDPYNNPAKARGGLLLAQNRVAQIRAKMKKAEGGPVQALTSFADRLEQSLKEGNTDRVTQIHNELNAFEPQMLDHYAKGGIIKPSQVLGILEKSRIPPAAWNPDSLRNVAEELRKLNPESPILKQYDAEVARAAARKAAAAAPSPTATIMAPAVGDQ
jgi:HPt (histidine-containing phosphotransfer) domain-containing protein